MKCDQCEALMINGTFCHETGCPNTNARYDEDSETWVKQWKCFECGCMVDEDVPCCAVLDEEYDDEMHHYVSVRYNADEKGNVTDWQVLDHGRENEQYFQGCGVAFTSYEHVATGIGDDAREALDDALDSMAQNSHVVTDEQDNAMLNEVL